MAPQRKRKHAAVEEPPTSRPNGSTKQQKRIKSFGHVSKPNEDEIIVETKKMRGSEKLYNQVAPAVQVLPKADKKRKRSVDIVAEDDVIDVGTQCRETTIPATPRSKRLRNVVPPSPARSAAALFDKLNINVGSSFTGPQNGQTSYGTPPATPEEGDISALQQLRGLYASFIAALSLHYSHNGTFSPVSVQVLLPMITKHWQKRNVNLDDLRLLLAIGHQSGTTFLLQDRGRAGICLSWTESCAGGHLNEEKLNSCFNGALDKAWQKWQANARHEERTAELFLDQIPLLDIVKNESVDKAAVLFARGQQRLADLKASSAATQLANNPKLAPGAAAVAKLNQTTTHRGSALLDRILAKQTLTSSLPAGLTKSQLERKAALDRIEDIARVLSLLAGTKERVSFSMATATQHLQQSLRNPISKPEVQRCLALMATEITPEFVKIVMSEGVHGVVVVRSGYLGQGGLRARLEKASQ